MVRGLRPVGLCVMKEPPPASARIDVTAIEGKRTLVLEKSGSAPDRYELVVDKDKLALACIGARSFSSADTKYVQQRIPADTFWVIGTYSDDATKQKLGPQLDAFIAALEAHGAKRYTPTAGRYAGGYEAWDRLAPDATPARGVESYVYLRYAGDLAFVEPLMKALGT